MDKEVIEIAELERIKMQSQAMASNPHTQNDYLKHLFRPQDDDEFVETGIDWTTPQSEEELEELARILDGR